MTGCVERDVRKWLEDFVIGLNLCPFARPVLGGSALRIAVSDESHPDPMQQAFLQELEVLQSSTAQEVATTLLVYPRALQDFQDYLRFLDDAQTLLTESGLEGFVQIASFHPDYQFAGEAVDAASQYSNRAPYPLIHLLREDMVSRALADFTDPERISDRNIEMLESIGVDELEHRWRLIFDGEV